MPSFIICELRNDTNESGTIEEICPFPGPYDSVRMPKTGEVFNGVATIFTVPRIRKLIYDANANVPDGEYEMPICFFKNGYRLLEGTGYSLSGDFIIFATPPLVTDVIYVAQLYNGAMWFEALTSDVYSTSVTSRVANSDNLVPFMTADTSAPCAAFALGYFLSTEYTGVYNPYKAFDGRTGMYNQGWISNNFAYNFPTSFYSGMTIESNVSHIGIDLGSAQVVNRFKIYPFKSSVGDELVNTFNMSTNTSPSLYRALGMSVINGNFVETTSEGAGPLAYKAFDGYSSTYWMPDSVANGNIISLDFGGLASINKASFIPHGTINQNVYVSIVKIESNEYVEVPNMIGAWSATSNEMVITPAMWAAGTAITLDSGSTYNARYWGIAIRIENITGLANPTYGIKEVSFYKKSFIKVQSPPRFIISGSNNGSSYTTLYTNNNVVWGTTAQNFDFVNTTAYRYYKISIPYFTTTTTSEFFYSYWGFDEIELYEMNAVQYFTNITINANLAQIEPGVQKLRITYYDANGILHIEYFNVPFWDGYELWADDLNDLTAYYADMIATELDDSGLYQITRDSDGYITKIDRSFNGYDGTVHSNALDIYRDDDCNIIDIYQKIDGAALENAAISRDLVTGMINSIEIELDS